VSKWVMQGHFRHLSSKSFAMKSRTLQSNGFRVLTLEIVLQRFRSPSRFQLPKWEFTWECGVHSLTLSHTPRNIKCDSQSSHLARTFASHVLVTSPRLGLRHPIIVIQFTCNVTCHKNCK
jgi:hypothetical protein